MTVLEQAGSLAKAARPFSEIPRLWLRIGDMTEAFFREELPYASAANTFYGVLVFTGVAGIFSILSSVIGSMFATTPAAAQSMNTLMGARVLLFCFDLVLTPVSFYLNAGVLYICAQIFGGKGGFTAQAYLVSLFYVPLGFVSTIASLALLVRGVGPILFAIVAFGIVIYHLRLTTRVFKAIHGFSTGKAIAAVLAPLVLIIIPVCMIAVLALMGPAIGNVFSGIISSLTPTP